MHIVTKKYPIDRYAYAHANRKGMDQRKAENSV